MEYTWDDYNKEIEKRIPNLVGVGINTKATHTESGLDLPISYRTLAGGNTKFPFFSFNASQISYYDLLEPYSNISVNVENSLGIYENEDSELLDLLEEVGPIVTPKKSVFKLKATKFRFIKAQPPTITG